MLYFVAVWSVLTGFCFSIGLAFLNAFKADCFERRGDRFIIAVWLGMVVYAMSLLATSLVLPLSPSVGLAIALYLLVLPIQSSRTRAEIGQFCSMLSPALIVGFFLLEFVVAALTTKQVTWYDAGLYHFGAIRWLADHGAVTGLALINSKFGFTSSWFAFTAPFNPQSFGSRVSAVTNGFAFFIGSWHFLISFAHLIKKNAQLSDWLVTVYFLITLPLLLFTTFMSAILISSSPDIPIILLTGVIGWAILIVSKNHTSPSPKVENPVFEDRAILLLLSSGAVTMKLSAIPLLVVSGFFYVFSRRFSMKRVFWGSTLSLLLLLPMVIFGITTSGCPLYPSTFMCLSFPWSVTGQKAIAEAAAINGWKTWFGSPPPGTNYLLWVFGEWLKLGSFNKIMLLLLVISLIFTIRIFKGAKISQITGEIWLLTIGGVGIVFIMTQAPLIRFGLGYFILIPSLLVARFCSIKLGTILPRSLYKKIDVLQQRLSNLSLAFLFFLLSFALAGLIHGDAQSRLILPPELPSAKVLIGQVNDINYVFPKDSDKCWAAKLPCAEEPIAQNIKLRDPMQGIRGGFTHVR